MAQYIPFDKGVEVNGETILSVVTALPAIESLMHSLLAKHGLGAVQPGEWYPQERWLDAFREIASNFGPNTLYMIGMSIPDNAHFPENITDMKSSLESINIAYHMNHRGGEIGYYRVQEYRPEERLAAMECKNPYPSHFDRGIIYSMAQRFQPSQYPLLDVSRETEKPSRLYGADSCTYRITWN